MSLLSLVIIAILLLFLASRSRKNPLFLAGTAFFLAISRSMYVDLFPGRVVVGISSSVTFTTVDLLFVAVALGWIYARARRPVPCVQLSTLWADIGVFIAFFLVLELALALANASEFHPTFVLASRIWFYIPFGFLMTLDILRRFTFDEVAQYVGTLCLFTACLMTLYIASALNAPVYPYEKYWTVPYHGGVIIRDFSTFSLWVGLAWCYYLSKPNKSAWRYTAMALLASGVVLSYTRAYIGMLVITAVLAVILLMFRRDRRSHAINIGLISAVLALIVLAIGSIAAPRQVGFLKDRFVGRGHSLNLNDSSVSFRRAAFDRAHTAGARIDPYLGLGVGLVDSSVNTRGDQYITSDSDWIGIVYRTGWVGIVVFAVPLLVAFWCGIRSFVTGRTRGAAERLVLIGVLATAWYTGLRFVSDVYVWWPAVSLLPVALIAYATGVPAVAATCRVDLENGLGDLRSEL